MDKLKIKWSQRLPLNNLKQLYFSQANGLLDEELLEDVAVTLYLRCKDIIAVDRAKRGEVRCPFCYKNEMKEIYIQANRDEYGRIHDKIKCDECSNEFSYAEYKLCYTNERAKME